jgi:hypothetical protein
MWKSDYDKHRQAVSINGSDVGKYNLRFRKVLRTDKPTTVYIVQLTDKSLKIGCTRYKKRISMYNGYLLDSIILPSREAFELEYTLLQNTLVYKCVENIKLFDKGESELRDVTSIPTISNVINQWKIGRVV